MISKWHSLATLANLKYEQELKKTAELRTNLESLAERRQSLNKMNEQALCDFSQPHPAHWHDGDFLWQTWVGRNVRALGMEEAKARALLEIHMPEMRKAFGRKSVTEALVRKETQ